MSQDMERCPRCNRFGVEHDPYGGSKRCLWNDCLWREEGLRGEAMSQENAGNIPKESRVELSEPKYIFVTAHPGQGCKCCGDIKAETRIGWCFDCAIAQEIIGEVLGEEKPIVTNNILKTLAQKGYAIVEHKFIKDAYEKGLSAR
jgi:hypothetical protein